MLNLYAGYCIYITKPQIFLNFFSFSWNLNEDTVTININDQDCREMAKSNDYEDNLECELSIYSSEKSSFHVTIKLITASML